MCVVQNVVVKTSALGMSVDVSFEIVLLSEDLGRDWKQKM